MKEKVHLDEKDFAVLEIIEDPVLFGEFIMTYNDSSSEEVKEWRYDNYQKKMLTDIGPYVSVCTGRATGKTQVLEGKLLQLCISNVYRKASNNEVLFVVQNKAQLEPIFLRLSRMFRTHPLLKYFIDRSSINMSSHEIRLTNGCLLRCRIIGSTADSNIIGLHVPCIFIDEAQVFSYNAWQSLQQCFPAGTLVETVDGAKKIEDIKIGDIVVSAKETRPQKVLLQPVKRLIHKPNKEKCVRVITTNGSFVDCTENHEFLTNNKKGGTSKLYKEAKHLVGGDKLVSYLSKFRVTTTSVVDRVEKLDTISDVYDLEIDGVPNYTANGFVVHNCLNTWDHNYFMWISGVPNGLREKNILFEADQEDLKWSRHNLSRLSSTRYTEIQRDSDLKQYGGENGDDWVHLVRGEHGSPAFSVFDRKLMKIEDYPVHVSSINNIGLEQHGGNFADILSSPDITPDIQKNSDLIVCGIDAGFSNDPTIITILWRDKTTLVWREFARYELRRIKYPIQAKVIDWLDTIYRFNMICIDAGSSGLALCQILQDETGDFKDKHFTKRLVPVDFQANVITGYDDEKKEIKDRVRKFTIQTLQKWSQNDQILSLSIHDDDVISELERVGFTRDMLGAPKYFVYSPQGGQKGEDHILASLLTWVYGYYYNYYSPEKPNSNKGKYSDLVKPNMSVKILR